ncbi:hypothetical protein JTB14_033156 [Gonioctena quinquepunctata]|nr:hypothetical protein JTB14_033156 [Gonioctena quinquepunctata]
MSVDYSDSISHVPFRAFNFLFTVVVCVLSRGALDADTMRAATVLGDTLSSLCLGGPAPPSLLDCLENITDKLSTKLGELENKIRSGDQEIFEDVKMRIERERNILIFGIDETSDANSVVKCIINDFTPPATSRIEAISRVKKPNNQKCRPIKVELSKKKDMLQVLKNKANIGKTQERSKRPRTEEDLPRQSSSKCNRKNTNPRNCLVEK